MSTTDSVLLVSSSPEELYDRLTVWLTQYDILIHVAKNGFDGLQLYGRYHPMLLLIDTDLPDMSGMSLSSIIKESENGKKTTIFLYNVDKVQKNTRTDFFFNATEDRQALFDSMHAQLQAFLDKRFMDGQHSGEMERARIDQYQRLPKPIHNHKFNVMNVFSPFNVLSGDCYDYWVSETENGFYGLIFDCTGHDLMSYFQVGKIRTLLKKDLKAYQMGFYKSLGEVMQSVNNDLFEVDVDPEPTAALIFHLDFNRNELVYCSAGIPSFFLKRHGSEDFETILTVNSLLAYEEDSTYETERMDIGGVDEVIFSTDGFSEVVFSTEPDANKDVAKGDDVSAIMIQFRRGEDQ